MIGFTSEKRVVMQASLAGRRLLACNFITAASSCRNDAWLAPIAQPALPAYTATIAGGRLALALASLGAAASLASGAGSNLRLRGGHSRAPSMAPMPPPPAPAANVPRLQTAAGPDFGDGAFQPNDMVRVFACLAAVAAGKLTRLTNR